MKIGAFIEKVNTTKDTVRHYEELSLLKPNINGRYKDYHEKDIQDFQAIKEMQSFGLSLTDITQIFEIKRENGCGNPALIEGVTKKLEEQSNILLEEEKRLKQRQLEVNALMQALEKTAGGQP